MVIDGFPADVMSLDNVDKCDGQVAPSAAHLAESYATGFDSSVMWNDCYNSLQNAHKQNTEQHPVNDQDISTSCLMSTTNQHKLYGTMAPGPSQYPYCSDNTVNMESGYTGALCAGSKTTTATLSDKSSSPPLAALEKMEQFKGKQVSKDSQGKLRTGNQSGRQPFDWMKKRQYPKIPEKGKTRTESSYRQVYTQTQVTILESEFKSSPYITQAKKMEVAKLTDLSERKVKIWFQNKRAHMRKKQKEASQINKTKSSSVHGGITSNTVPNNVSGNIPQPIIPMQAFQQQNFVQNYSEIKPYEPCSSMPYPPISVNQQISSQSYQAQNGNEMIPQFHMQQDHQMAYSSHANNHQTNYSCYYGTHTGEPPSEFHQNKPF